MWMNSPWNSVSSSHLSNFGGEVLLNLVVKAIELMRKKVTSGKVEVIARYVSHMKRTSHLKQVSKNANGPALNWCLKAGFNTLETVIETKLCLTYQVHTSCVHIYPSPLQSRWNVCSRRFVIVNCCVQKLSARYNNARFLTVSCPLLVSSCHTKTWRQYQEFVYLCLSTCFLYWHCAEWRTQQQTIDSVNFVTYFPWHRYLTCCGTSWSKNGKSQSFVVRSMLYVSVTRNWHRSPTRGRFGDQGCRKFLQFLHCFRDWWWHKENAPLICQIKFLENVSEAFGDTAWGISFLRQQKPAEEGEEGKILHFASFCVSNKPSVLHITSLFVSSPLRHLSKMQIQLKLSFALFRDFFVTCVVTGKQSASYNRSELQISWKVGIAKRFWRYCFSAKSNCLLLVCGSARRQFVKMSQVFSCSFCGLQALFKIFILWMMK